MEITKYLLPYLLTALVFFGIDIVWLGVVAQKLYQKYLGSFLSDQVNWTAAIIFYLLFIVGIFIFAIVPAHEKNSLQTAILFGVLFGFFTYATYDLTNYATLKDWPVQIVFIDILWGVILTGATAVAGFYIMKWLG